MRSRTDSVGTYPPVGRSKDDMSVLGVRSFALNQESHHKGFRGIPQPDLDHLSIAINLQYFLALGAYMPSTELCSQYLAGDINTFTLSYSWTFSLI